MNKETKEKNLAALTELWDTYGNTSSIHSDKQALIYAKHKVSRTMSTVLLRCGFADRVRRGYIKLRISAPPTIAMVDAISKGNKAMQKEYQDKKEAELLKKVQSQVKLEMAQKSLESFKHVSGSSEDAKVTPKVFDVFPSMPNPSPYNNTTEMQAISLLKSLGYKIMKPVAPQFEEL